MAEGRIYVTKSMDRADASGGPPVPHIALLIGPAGWTNAVIRRAHERGYSTSNGLSLASSRHHTRLPPWLRHRRVVAVLPGDDARAEQIRESCRVPSGLPKGWEHPPSDWVFPNAELMELIAREGRRWDGHADAEALMVRGRGRRPKRLRQRV
jgi:hypothetical protein